MSEYIRTKLTIPVEIADEANRVASVFDPDVGGGDTFGIVELSPTGEPPATHYMANTLIKPQYLPVLSNYEQALAALTHLADVYGRERPDPKDVAAFCDGVIVGDHDGLVKVEF
jgi:hypothetical protein